MIECRAVISPSLVNNVYDSAKRPSPFWGELVELLRYGGLARLMVGNTIKTRYKRSSLGVIWTLLNPLLSMVVLTIAFSTFFRSSLEHYPVYVLSGLIFWNFYTQTTTYAMNSLVWGGGLLKRIYLPRTIFAVTAVGNGLVNLAISFIPLVLIMLALGHPFYLTWWIMPLSILLLAMFSLGAALFFSILAVFFTDVLDMYQVGLQALFFLTPIMYPQEILPPTLKWYLTLNPLYSLLEMFRAPVYFGILPSPLTIAAAGGAAIAVLCLGWWAFTRKADELGYRL
jgi:ABC-type polysaccharide/polyol phosphate export permease